MAKPKLGIKYICESCSTKFYDLGRASPVCPKCSWDPLDASGAPSDADTILADSNDDDDDDGSVLKLRAVLEGEARDGFRDAFGSDAIQGDEDEDEDEKDDGLVSLESLEEEELNAD